MAEELDAAGADAEVVCIPWIVPYDQTPDVSPKLATI